MTMRFKSCPAFKVDPAAAEAGTFEAIVSVFGNLDSAGDVVMPGAFSESLAEWRATGDPIPVLWSHRMDDPRMSIGKVLDIAELESGDARIPDWAGEWLKANGGLWVKGQINTGPDATDVAVAAHKLLKNRLVKQFSYAYDIQDAGWGTVDGRDAYELRKLSLFEVSPTQIGANNLTQLLGAKAAALVAAAPHADPEHFRRHLAGMDVIEVRDLIDHLKVDLRGRIDSTTVDGTGASDGGTVKDEEPSQVKSEEPARRDDKSIRLLTQLIETETEYAS